MTDFTPFSALAGGALIGLAAVTMMLFLGRIAGVSGIVGGLLEGRAGEVGWRLAFLAGLVAGAALMIPAIATDIRPQSGTAVLVLGGLLVGFGTRLGGGCTSGHGVCGLARLSRRSLAATLLFMAAAVATLFVARRLLGA